MLRRLTQVATRPITIAFTQSSSASTSSNAAQKEKWDLYAGVLVERQPIIAQTFNQLEQKFQELLWRVEYENSLKSNHELKHEADLRQTELLKKGQLEVDLDENASKQTAQDLKDAYTEELKQFKAAPRTTADDKTNNLTSTNRCLDDTLYLLVEQQLGSKPFMLLPQGPRQDGETMRQAAERILREHCGDALQVQFYGHAPCGFYKYKYPRATRETQSTVGAKVFFYRAAWRAGNVTKATTGKSSNKFEWLPKPTLATKLTNKEYADSVQRFLL